MQRLNAENPSSKNSKSNTRKTAAQEPDDYRTAAARKVAIKTTGGRYEAELIEDNPNNCPIQRKMNLIRYTISRPRRMMRNTPKYREAEEMKNQQVPKFDIRNPDPVRQFWNRRGENSEHADRECLIETMGGTGKANNSSSRTHSEEHSEKKRMMEIIPKEHARTKTIQYGKRGKAIKSKKDTKERYNRQQGERNAEGKTNC